MATISACLIAKNEGKRIGKCLGAIIDVVDQMIVVDTGSTDNTKDIAKWLGAEVYDHEWEYDFAKARNESFKHATSDWIIWLDCDDYFKEEDIEKFLKLKNELDNTDADVYGFWYAYRHDPVTGKCTYKFLRDRLIRNHKGFHWDYPVHEALLVNGKIINTDITVTHTSNHDNGQKYIDFFEYKMKNQGYKLRQRDMYYYGGELSIFDHTDESQKVFEEFFAMGDHDNYYEAKRGAEYLFNIYIKKEMWMEAYKTALTYLRFGGPDALIFWKLGHITEKMGRTNEAIMYYKICLEMGEYFVVDMGVEFDHTGFKFSAAMSLSCMLYYQGKLDEARKYHNICKEIDPNSELVKNNEPFFTEKKEDTV